jgi:LCP family protein required for cell wall assembly
VGKHLAQPVGRPGPDRPPPPRRSSRLWRRNVPIAALSLLFVFCIAIGYLAVRAKLHHRSLQQEIVNIFIPSPEQLFGKDRIHVLVVGLDYDYTDRDMHYSSHSRTDTILALTLDFPTRSLTELSVPRDMDAMLPQGHEEKINAAYVYGGIRESDQVIGSFLGLPQLPSGWYFDRYVVLRVDAAKDLIDAIGGIDLDVKNSNALRHSGPNGPLDYDDNWGHLHIHLKPGMQHLDGEQAVGYARFRHDWCSDPCRILRQQQVLRATIAKLKADKLNDLAHIRQLLGVARRDIDTNFTQDEELSLATAFADVDGSQIRTAQVPYAGDKEVAAGDVLIPDDAGKQKLVQELMLGPLGSPPTPPASVVAAIAPSQLLVDVLNGSGVNGMASKFAAMLRAKGYRVGKVGNADSYDHEQTLVYEHSKVFGAAERVRSDFGMLSQMTVSPDPDPAPSAGWRSDVTVVVGKDFADALGAAKTGSTGQPGAR